MTAIIDYGVGNLFSLKSSFAAIGEDAVVTSDPDVILSADRVVLPGVGAFSDAAKKLFETGLSETVRAVVAKGTPLLGICLGMQLLFEKSREFGECDGLGLFKGEVLPLSGIVPSGYKIPEMGWNALHFTGEKPALFKYTEERAYVYFVHSYYAACEEDALAAVTDYGARVTAAVAQGNVSGCQFHPEKSGSVGLSILKAFTEM